MNVFGIAGHSGMGKTTLLERLIPLLTARGRVVSLVKHSHKVIEVDRPGKDSYRLREAGCQEVLLLGEGRWALMHELRAEAEPSAVELARHMTPVDLLLIEGFKREPHDKLEIYRADNGKPLLANQDPTYVAILTDSPVAEAKVPVIDLNDVRAIADFIVAHCGLKTKG